MLPVVRVLPTAHRRAFVSTVLLSRTWDSETLVELRKEAKARGLSTKGNKSTLVARIREHEANSAACVSSHGTARNASSNVVSPKKTSQAASPGIPLAVLPADATRSDFLAIKLPSFSLLPANAPVQVPYVPYSWNSARPKPDVPLEPELPKLHVVSGSATHYDGGPTHNLEKHREDSSTFTAVPADDPRVSEEGFRAEYSGLPRPPNAHRTLSEARDSAAQAGKNESRAYSRPLTNGERKGLYVLLGIIGGSWLVGGLVNRRTVVVEEHVAQSQH